MISGPNTVPCGTLDFTESHTEIESSTLLLVASSDLAKSRSLSKKMFDFKYHKMIIWLEVVHVKLVKCHLEV